MHEWMNRWDYIFSYIKKMKNRADCVTPDRQHITMQTPFMKAYVDLLVRSDLECFGFVAWPYAMCMYLSVHAMMHI